MWKKNSKQIREIKKQILVFFVHCVMSLVSINSQMRHFFSHVFSVDRLCCGTSMCFGIGIFTSVKCNILLTIRLFSISHIFNTLYNHISSQCIYSPICFYLHSYDDPIYVLLDTHMALLAYFVTLTLIARVVEAPKRCVYCFDTSRTQASVEATSE